VVAEATGAEAMGAMDDDDTRTGMTGRARFVYGPRPLGSVVPDVTRPSYRRHNPASAQIVADWEIIVGPKVASMTVPRRLDRGVLTISCAGPTAMDLHYMGVEVTQAGMPRKGAPARPPPPEAAREAEAAVAGLPDGELKSALAALGRVVIGRSKHPTRISKKL